jgi:SAM-dependent methyltransferase/GNAT superfamily N-acetyltransferase
LIESGTGGIDMDSLRYVQESSPAEADIRFIEQRILEYNVDHIGYDDAQRLAIFLRDAEDRIAGGVVGYTYWRWLAIDFLWVRKELRGQGYGARLLSAAEEEAQARGCEQALVDTFDFQAPGFYTRNGFEQYGALDGFAGQYRRLYFRKRLGPPTSGGQPPTQVKKIDARAHNRQAWDRWVEQGIEWTVPVGPYVIAAARQGKWEIYLTESKPVPSEWFPDLTDLDVLCLASGGGQQGPILAAAGARVTVLDNSPRQLAQDRSVAEREGLRITLIEGDMADLSAFLDGSFDLIVHPVSNVFVPDVHPVWTEAYRVLRRGGILLAGFMNPIEYAFDRHLADTQGIFQLRYALPYSDLDSISEEERQRLFGKEEPVEFSHTLEDQIGGQLDAGFLLTGLYESHRQNDPITAYVPSYVATRAIKPVSDPSR